MRYGQGPRPDAAEVAVERQIDAPRPRRGRRRARRRGSRWRRGGPCSGVPSSSIRAASTPAWSAASTPRSAGPISSMTWPRPSARPCHRSGSCRRRGARPPRGRRSRRPRNRRTADRAVAEHDVDLDRRVAARIEDLASLESAMDVSMLMSRSPPSARSIRTATPGSSRPSRNSRVAPPPVEIWVNRAARPCCWIAATESPPPTTTVAPASQRAARKRARWLVPSANDGISNTPSGPFQKTVLASASAASMSSIVAAPTSTMCHEAGIFSADSVLYSVPRVTSLATMTSTGRITRTPFASAEARTRLASSTMSCSARLLPIALPCASRNVLAIPPPRTRMSTFERRLSRTLSLPDTFAPPTIAANG